MSERDNLSLAGRTKCVIVFNSGSKPVGIVSDVVVRVLPAKGSERLSFRGPVRFKDSSRQHLVSFVISVVDRIMDTLSVPRKNYEASVVNPGATALTGIGAEVSGFSTDLPILIALISASLQMPLKQGIVSTGHVASLDGDLVCVRGIPAKLEAILASPEIFEFVLPDPDREGSAKLLTPIEYQSAKESLLRRKGDINIHSVGNLLEALKIFFTNEAIVIGSLKSGFFYRKTPETESQGHIVKILDFFKRDNETRFWDVLEHAFLNQDLEKARMLLLTYVEFHIRNQLYPNRFGEHLFNLVISLPPSTRKLDDLFPLLPMELCIKLTQYADKNDHGDVRKLYKSVFDEGFGEFSYPTKAPETIPSSENDYEKELIGWLLSELSRENLAKKVGQPLDRARASYVMDTVTVRNGSEFNDAITAFCTHVYRYTGSPVGNQTTTALSAEAIDLVKNAFARQGGYNAALSEGKFAINGGMRIVFDAMTEYMKSESKEKFITKTFKESIDPLDWDAKVKLMEVFMKRIELELPADLRDLPAKQLASHWESIIQYYAESMYKVADLLKKI